MNNPKTIQSICKLADSYLLACDESEPCLCEATFSDSDLYFNWVNNPEYMAISSRSEPVSWDQHLSVFSRNLQSEKVLLFKFCTAAQVYGQITFSHINSFWVLGYHLDPPYRHRGLGRKLLVLGMAYLFRHPAFSLEPLLANVIKTNVASIALLKSLGFTQQASTVEPGHITLTLNS